MKARLRLGALGLYALFFFQASWTYAQEEASQQQTTQPMTTRPLGQLAAQQQPTPPTNEPATQQPATRLPPAQQPAPAQPATPQPPPGQQPAPSVQGPPRPAEAPGAPGDQEVSLDFFYWLISAQPKLRAGANATTTTTTTDSTGVTTTTTTTTGGDLLLPGKTRRAPGFVLSIPAGKYNAVRVSYFQTRGSADTTAASDVTLFSTAYTAGDFLTTSYTLRSAKISLDYLSYPFPVHTTGFRLRTLWEIQYTNFKTTIDAPNKAITVNPDGTTVSNTATGSRSIIYPMLGAGIEHVVSKKFRWEAKASGFGIPHHAVTWDAEGWLAYRIGQVELRGGYKGFYFKTSPKNEQYVTATMSGLYVNLRWYPTFW